MAQTNPRPCPDGCQGYPRRASKPRFSRRLTGFRRLCYFEFTPVGEAASPAAIPRRLQFQSIVQVITGFNTDIEFEGVTYHVQTEDKGLDSPLILSLVYVGGAIIASKRMPYDDLVSAGYDEKVLTERLQRQHKLICAAIRSGRAEDLKRMGGQNGSADAESRKKGRTPSEAFKAAGKSGVARKKKSEAAPPVVESATDESSNGEGA